MIISNPDPPVNLVENYSQRSVNTLGFTWEDGAEDRGAEVTEWKVFYSVNSDTGPFYTLATMTQRTFLAQSL